jgi:hypothetical protein
MLRKKEGKNKGRKIDIHDEAKTQTCRQKTLRATFGTCCCQLTKEGKILI